MERSKTLLNLTGFRAIGKLASALAPHAYCFVALRGYPRHMNGILAALRDAVFLAPASIWPRQHGNASFDFEACDAAHLNAIYASGAFAGVHYRYPFLFHGMSVVGRFPPIISR
jgi:hypothetical protein